MVIQLLTIRKAQIAAFDAMMMRRFEGRVLARLTQELPAAVRALGGDGARAYVETAIRNATGYGVVEDADAERYVLLLAGHGLGADAMPDEEGRREILEDADLPGDAKVQLLERRLAALANADGRA
jgi:PAS domain-containing protein